jgi:hypothetical protein
MKNTIKKSESLLFYKLSTALENVYLYIRLIYIQNTYQVYFFQ